MTDLTPLDHAHAAMQAAPDGEPARLSFYRRFVETELFVMLTAEAANDQISPEIFPVDGDNYILAFDREDRLAEFAGREVPYAGLSGRALIGMMAGQDIGVALNPDVAPSSYLFPATVLAWMAELLRDAPEVHQARVTTIDPPGGLPQALITALDAKLASAAGLAEQAYLIGVTFENGAKGHLLGIVDPLPGAEDALAGAVREALVFSGLEAGALDVGFFQAHDPMTARMARHGLRFDLPELSAPEVAPRAAPGSDPDKPPILR